MSLPMDVWRRIRSHAGTPLYGNAYALVANQAINAVLGVAFWVIAARLFSPVVVGTNAALISSMTFVAFFSQLGMRNSMTWLLPTTGASGGRYVARAYVVSVVVSCALAPFMLLLFSGISDAPEILTGGLLLTATFALSSAVSAIFAMQDGVLVGLRVARWVPIENAGFGLLKIVLLPLLATAGLGIFAAWTLSTAPFVMLVTYIVFRRILPARARAYAGIEPPPSGRIMRFVSGDFVGNLTVQGTIRLMPILILAMLGSVANAYSYQAWTLAVPIFFVAGSMVSSLTVESLTAPARATDYARRMLVNMLAVLGPLALLLVLAAPVILGIFGEVYAREASGLLRLLALATIPTTLNVWFYALCRIRGTVVPIIIGQSLASTLAISLSVLLMPPLGIIGSGIGWLVGQSTVAVFVVAREFRWSAGAGLSWPRNLKQGWNELPTQDQAE
jgi:O-antigen/teichoic acid export membrane protein